MYRSLPLLTCAVLLWTACNQITSPDHPEQSDLLSSHLDTTVHPGDDFFTYANGGWLKKNPIPATESGWGIFNLVADENYAQLKKISENASASNAAKGTPQQQIGDFFFSGMDTTRMEKEGLHDLQALLQAIQQVTKPEDVWNRMTDMQMAGADPGFNMNVGQDLKNSARYRILLGQGGLGMPNRDYYFNTDERTRHIRELYPQHIEHILQQVYGDANKSKQAAQDILNLETSLATSHKKLEELRDPQANYHKFSMDELTQLTPGLNWKHAFQTWGVQPDSVIVGQPEFYKTLQTLLQKTSIETWKAYLTWNLIHNYAICLPAVYEQEHFEFYQKLLGGAREQRPRWKRVIDIQESALGDAMGQLFVKEYFPEKTKQRYDALVEQIVISFREHISHLDWMSDSTREKALHKLNSITRKVGYPAKWKDYRAMDIGKRSFVANVMESRRWRFQYDLNKLAKPVDRTEWDMTPQTYNAYYNPSNNEIVLPAAIFTAPGYKDEELDDAIVYGYVGASTIGHELTHGFDDEGRQFDEKGNLKNWWSADDEKKFKERADQLVEQFNSYVVLDSLHPNGKASLGENFADLGGIVIALDAFKKTKQYQEGKSIEGLTPLQRFFLGYAYGWMQVRRPEKVASLLLTDVHAPIFLRVNGPMSNCDGWYEAFHVSAANKLYRDSQHRVRIW